MSFSEKMPKNAKKYSFSKSLPLALMFL